MRDLWEVGKNLSPWGSFREKSSSVRKESLWFKNIIQKLDFIFLFFLINFILFLNFTFSAAPDGMWILVPRPGIEPVSSALSSGVLITGLPGSPSPWFRREFFRRHWASLMAQMVKNLPAMWETWVQSLGWEDPLEEGMATHSSILAWRIPVDRGAWWATVHGVTKSRTWLSN